MNEKLLTTLGCASLLLCACGPAGPKTGGQTGEETIGCRPKTTTTLARDEVSPIGFSAEETMQNVEGEHTIPFEWMVHDPTSATITVTPTGTYEYVEYEWFDSNDDGRDIALGTPQECDALVEFLATIELTTDDGQLDETLDVRVLSGSVGESIVYQPVDLEMLGGTFVVTTEVPDDDPTWVNQAIDFMFSNNGMSGEFHAAIERTDEDAVSAERIVFGSWTEDAQ